MIWSAKLEPHGSYWLETEIEIDLILYDLHCIKKKNYNIVNLCMNCYAPITSEWNEKNWWNCWFWKHKKLYHQFNNTIECVYVYDWMAPAHTDDLYFHEIVLHFLYINSGAFKFKFCLISCCFSFSFSKWLCALNERYNNGLLLFPNIQL